MARKPAAITQADCSAECSHSPDAPDPLDGQVPLPDISNVDATGWAGARFTVLAVGNPIMGDDGIGLQILAGLQQLLPTRPAWQAAQKAGELALLEGGTGGMELVPVVQESEQLLILDSVAPGSGTGRVDGPRGILAHTYTIGADGTIQAARILTPTAQNEPWLAQLLTQASALDQAQQAGAWEQSIREADPCLPISSAPAGQMGLKVENV